MPAMERHLMDLAYDLTVPSNRGCAAYEGSRMIEAVLERLRPMFPAIAFATDMTDDGTVYGCLFTKGGRGPQCCYTVECPDGASVTAFTVRDVADDDKLIGVASSMFQACDLVLEVTMGSFTTRTAH